MELTTEKAPKRGFLDRQPIEKLDLYWLDKFLKSVKDVNPVPFGSRYQTLQRGERFVVPADFCDEARDELRVARCLRRARDDLILHGRVDADRVQVLGQLIPIVFHPPDVGSYEVQELYLALLAELERVSV